jgi:predicted Fe-S protein YdhL (DUF1289 family)
MDREEIPSPCTRICELDPQGGFCSGCGRTVRELSEWSRAPDGRKREILDRLSAAGWGPAGI